MQIVDVAPVDRADRGAAEDAARKALTRVVDAVADRRSHVPYRDSKLTRIAARALGGGARLVVVFGVSERSSAFDETDATLRFAARVANGVKNRPAPTTTRFAAAVAEADAAAARRAAALGVAKTPGLTSAGIQLEMDSSDARVGAQGRVGGGRTSEKRRGRVRGDQNQIRSRQVRRRRVTCLFSSDK